VPCLPLPLPRVTSLHLRHLRPPHRARREALHTNTAARTHPARSRACVHTRPGKQHASPSTPVSPLIRCAGNNTVTHRRRLVKWQVKNTPCFSTGQEEIQSVKIFLLNCAGQTSTSLVSSVTSPGRASCPPAPLRARQLFQQNPKPWSVLAEQIVGTFGFCKICYGWQVFNLQDDYALILGKRV